MQQEISSPYDAMLKDYYEIVANWAKEQNVMMSSHAIEVASKILAHRDKALPYPPGGFIQAFLDNNLERTVSQMGSTLRPFFWEIFKAWYNIDSYYIRFKHFPEKTGIE